MGRGRQQWYSSMMLEKDGIAGHYVFVCLCVCCAENLFTLLSLYPVHGTCFGGAAGVPKKKTPQKTQETNTNCRHKSIQVSLFSWRTPPSFLYIPCVCVSPYKRQREEPAGLVSVAKSKRRLRFMSLQKGLGSMSPAYRPLKRRLFMFSLQSSQYHFAAGCVSKPSPSP